MKYILVIAYLTTPSIAFQKIEFNNLVSCQKALLELRLEYNRKSDVNLKLNCLAKGRINENKD